MNEMTKSKNEQKKRSIGLRRGTRLPHLKLPGFFQFITCACAEKLLLSDEEMAVVFRAIMFQDKKLYDLWPSVVMETHFHIIIKPNVPGVKIMHSLKSFTAHEISKLRGGAGRIWLREYYDWVIRSERDYVKKVEYITNNPLKTGFRNYKWLYVSSESPV